MLRVVLVVAPLTNGTQVGRVAILWGVVKVGYGQHNPHHLLRLLVEEPRIVLTAAELAMVLGAFKDACAYLLPVGWVTLLVLWSYRHITYAFGDNLLLHLLVQHRHSEDERKANHLSHNSPWEYGTGDTQSRIDSN